MFKRNDYPEMELGRACGTATNVRKSLVRLTLPCIRARIMRVLLGTILLNVIIDSNVDMLIFSRLS